MKTILKIVGEQNYNSFFQCWMKEYFFIQNKEEHFNLFFEEDFKQLLNMTYRHIRYPDIRLVKNGNILDEELITTLFTTKMNGTIKQVSPQKIWQHFNFGATIVLNAINNLDNNLFELANKLSEEFNCYVQINSYYSPINASGFNLHYDTHEVLILQINGKKEWYLAPATFQNPLAENHFSKVTSPTDLPYHLVMNPGDILYIPRGMWHCAKTTSQSSFHLTIGFYCKNYIDILKDAIEILKEDPKMREGLPINFESLKVVNEIASVISPILETTFNKHILSIENNFDV